MTTATVGNGRIEYLDEENPGFSLPEILRGKRAGPPSYPSILPPMIASAC